MGAKCAERVPVTGSVGCVTKFSMSSFASSSSLSEKSRKGWGAAGEEVSIGS
jgi:hypothetical protein